MTWASIGIGTSDFINNALADQGTSVSLVPAQITEHESGRKSVIFSGTSTKTVVFHIRTIDYQRTKEGIRQLAPAYMMHQTDSDIKRGDKIIIGTGTASEWKVKNVVPTPKEEPHFNYSDMYVWE